MFDLTDPTVISAVTALVTYYVLQNRKDKKAKKQPTMNDVIIPMLVAVVVFFALTQMDMGSSNCYDPTVDLITKSIRDQQSIYLELANF